MKPKLMSLIAKFVHKAIRRNTLKIRITIFLKFNSLLMNNNIESRVKILI